MKKYSIIIILFIFLIQPILAITVESNACAKNKQTEIEYNDILQKAIYNSHDLKIADFNVLISKTGVKSARSEYFPKLNFVAGTEYTHNFRDYKNSVVTTVGDLFINPYTRFQSVLGITLSYTLFDFGVRKGQLNIAKEEIKIQEAKQLEAFQELKLTLLDKYTQILLITNQIEINKDLLALENNNYALTERLYKAKEVSKTELNDSKIKVQNTEKDIQELKKMLDENLLWLGFYTGESYDVNNIIVNDIKPAKFNLQEYFDYSQSLIWKLYLSEIKKKELELGVTKKANYPKIAAYGRYYIYGADQSSYRDSLGDIKPSSYTVGGSLYMPLFDGLKNRADIEKAKLELQQKYVERDRAIAEWMTRVAALKSNYLYLDEITKINSKNLDELSQKEKDTKRLLSKKLVTPIDTNNAQIEYLKEKIEYDKNNVTQSSIAKGIEILTEKYGTDK